MGRVPCCEKEHTNKGAWTKDEDQRLVAYIRAYGEGSWRSLPKAAGLRRCGKSCRLRWINYLRPDLKRGNFTEEEDNLIIKLHSHFGNKWSLIAGQLPGRTDNEIKNYWNTYIKRKLCSRGIDPQTHLPLKTIQNKSQREGSSAASVGGLGLNLDLSISLRYSSADERSVAYSDKPSKMKTSTKPAFICLCFHLGFRSSEDCSCKSLGEKYAALRHH